MKKTILLVLTFGILFGMVIITLRKAIETNRQMPAMTLPDLTTLPNFQFEDLAGKVFSNLDLKTDISTLIIHYNSHCQYCVEEAKIISEYPQEFEHSQILFISNQNKKLTKEFQYKYSLDAYHNIYFLQYKKDKFKHIFGTHKTPSLYIFDTHFKLLKNINEAVSAKTLIKYTRAANDR